MKYRGVEGETKGGGQIKSAKTREEEEKRRIYHNFWAKQWFLWMEGEEFVVILEGKWGWWIFSDRFLF